MNYLNTYFISNLCLIVIYPITRVIYRNSFALLDQDFQTGTSRENTIFYTIFAVGILKYCKRISIAHFFQEFFFTCKLALIFCYIMVDLQILVYYIFACLVQFLLVSTPQFHGAHKFISVTTKEEFNKLLTQRITKSTQEKLKGKKRKQKLQIEEAKTFEDKFMIFVEFYTDWADTCQSTKEIWSEFSLKYSTKQLIFVQVNLQLCKDLAEEYDINTSAISRQLPTIIIFEDGVESSRFPPIDEDTGKIGKVVKYDKKLLAKFFELERRYLLTK